MAEEKFSALMGDNFRRPWNVAPISAKVLPFIFLLWSTIV
jgi:hypothetical protein